MQKDCLVIPHGEYCYRILPINEGEILSRDIHRFGKDLREYRYRGNFKEVLCPYWERTDYGTIRCNYLELEVVDEDDNSAKQKLADYFGTDKAIDQLKYSWALSDEIKVCGINQENDDED